MLGDATRGGSPHPLCKHDKILMIMRSDMDRRVTSPTWDPPPPCKQALEAIVCCAPRYKDKRT